MKKSLLLIALPGLMVLSSCAAGNAANKKDNLAFKEDAFAHAEIFGGEDEGIEMKKVTPYKMSSIDDFVEPKIGVQYKPKYEKVQDSGEWFVALRFIAAVGTLDVDATWTRDIYKNDGVKYSDSVVQQTTKAYEILNGGEGIGTVRADEEIQEGTDDLVPYNYYVVYTIYDIPEATFDDYYITASLKLSDPVSVHDDVYSKEMAARIGGGVGIKYNKDKSGFFLAGTIDGHQNGIVDPNSDIKGGNAAAFANYFDADDSFVAVQKESNLFKVWDGNALQDGNADAAKDGRFVKINTAARYAIYLNTSDQLWHTAYTGYPTDWDFHVRGIASTGNWDNIADDNDAYRLHADPTNKGFIRVELGVGDFKLTHRNDWNDAKGYSDRVTGAEGSAIDGTHIGEGEGGNFKCLTPGVYDIYLNNSWKVHFVFVGAII